ncbi:annexin A1 [Latimeria chalumnae]|uniref:annexin A1 n=1 Tax=Latimeria chalumnae TaxID=7897 RepID=UPI0003C18308|nr:PREDICTED: annexin A1-like [Latimeria chalumnae]|eukprot:XP_006006358.1 PREDICTED: annexin A1-like [Latimeria chalumnae]
MNPSFISEVLKQAGESFGTASKSKGPSVTPYRNFNASKDVAALDTAINTKGVDEETILEIFTQRNHAQRQQIKAIFQQVTGKSLEVALKSVLSGPLEDVILALLKTPAQFDAHELKHAMKGLGTDEECLTEILASRTNKEIKEIVKAYKEEFQDDLEGDIASDTSGDFEKALLALAKGNRSEDWKIDEDAVDNDARALFSAGERKKGTDVLTFITILTTRSYPHLSKVFERYRKYSQHDLNKVLDLELKGDIENCLTAIVKCVGNTPAFFADKLYNATKDKELIRIMVSRSEVDMNDIKAEYRRSYGKSLYEALRDKTTGYYQKSLLALCGMD